MSSGRNNNRNLVIAGSIAVAGVGGLLLLRNLATASRNGPNGGTPNIQTVSNTLVVDTQPPPSTLTKEVGDQFLLRWAVTNQGNANGWAQMLIGEAGFASDPLGLAIGGSVATLISPGATIILDATGPTSNQWPVDTGPFNAVIGVWAGESPLSVDPLANTLIDTYAFTLTVNSPATAAFVQITEPSGSLIVPVDTQMDFVANATGSQGENLDNSIEWWIQLDNNAFFHQFTGPSTVVNWNAPGFNVVEARVTDPSTNQPLVDSVGIVVQ